MEERVDSNTVQSGVTIRAQLRHAVKTDVGRRRSENQDSYGIASSVHVNLYIVADGMGGARGGATASALAVNLIPRVSIDSQGILTEHSLKEAIEKTNDVIYSQGSTHSSLAGMGTTVVALAFLGDRAVVAHVGDSRIYLLRDGELKQLTRDHTLVQELVESGAIAEKDAENHPVSHMLTRSLGPTSHVEVDARTLDEPVKEGDRFLLCCDGLFNMVPVNELQKIVSSVEPEAAAERLIELANERGGTDNITVEIIEVLGFAPAPDPSTVTDAEEGAGLELIASTPLSDIKLGVEDLPDEEGDAAIELVNEYEESTSTPQVSQEPPKKAPAAGAPTAGGSVYDSVIFGEQPTASDIQSHQEKYGQKPEAEQAELEATNSEKGQPSRESDVEEGESLETEDESGELSAAEIQALKRVGVGAVAVIALALCVLGYTLLLKKGPEAGSSPIPVGYSANKSAVDPLAAEKRKSEQAVGDKAGEHEREIALRELANWEPKTGSATPAETAAAVQPSAVAVGVSVLESKNTGPESENAETTDEVAGPDIVPVKDFGEQGLAPERPVTIEPELQYEEPPAELKGAITRTWDLSVPSIPAVESYSAGTPDQPIVWEHEELAKEQAEQASARDTDQKSFQLGQVSKMLNDVERVDIYNRKVQLREKIADVDAKLRALNGSAEERAKVKESALKAELKVIEQALEFTNKQLETAKHLYSTWLERRSLAETGGLLRVADTLAKGDADIRREKLSFEKSSLRYQAAVEKFREDTANTSTVGEMTSYGEEMKVLKARLEGLVSKAIHDALESTASRISEQKVILSDLVRRQAQINRHIGFTKGLSSTPAKRRAELQRSLFEERSAQTKELESLRSFVSDTDEITLRRALALKDTGVKLP